MMLSCAAMLSVGLSAPALAGQLKTPDTGHAQAPVWASDGSHIAFTINDMTGSTQLWWAATPGGQGASPARLDIPGGGAAAMLHATWAAVPHQTLLFAARTTTTRLYYATPGAGAPAELLATDRADGDLSAPAMSPSGTHMAFISDGDLYTWEVATNTVTPAGATDQEERFPAPSAAGDTIVFARSSPSGHDLFVWQGGSAAPLLGGSGDQTRPGWAGDRVVYFTNERGEDHWDIGVTDRSSRHTIIARDVRLPPEGSPALTPSGDAVAFASADPDQGDRIFIAKLDGSGVSEIKTGLTACAEPALVEAGGRIWLAFTALPRTGASWRGLYVEDVTGKL